VLKLPFFLHFFWSKIIKNYNIGLSSNLQVKLFSFLSALQCPWKRVLVTRLNWPGAELPDAICILKPKIPIWVSFGLACNGRPWCMRGPFGPFYGYLLHFVAIWYILFILVHFSPFWYVVPRNIWQPWPEARFWS
jgi:hypothetical protein